MSRNAALRFEHGDKGGRARPLTANQIAIKAAVDYALASAAFVEPVDPDFEAPAPRAVRGFDKALRAVARQLGGLHEMVHSGGVSGTGLLGGGVGGLPSAPQERVVWALGRLRVAARAIGGERLPFGPRPFVVSLVGAVCARDLRVRTWLRLNGVVPNGDRQRVADEALESALARVADFW